MREPEPPIFTFISGHMGSFCREDLRGFRALGIRDEDLPDLMRDLHKVTAKHLHACVSTYARNVRQESRAPAAGLAPSNASAPSLVNVIGPSPAPSNAAATPPHAAGIG